MVEQQVLQESWPTIDPVPAADTLAHWKALIQREAKSLGFEALGITDIELAQHAETFRAWLAKGYHGDLGYLERHLEKRLNPAELVPGTVRVLSVRLRYQPEEDAPLATLEDPSSGYIARYALGRDYHKVVRQRLNRLAATLSQAAGQRGKLWRFRAFADSAPVLERPLAVKAGLGWVGKHSLVLDRDAGSWFFLGELFTNLPLPIDTPTNTDHCGNCHACMTVCPTNAIVAPGVLDARRCISYHTIESKRAIPLSLRRAIGNRIFGCDDCQLYCPWNRNTPTTEVEDFAPRQWSSASGTTIDLRKPSLVELFRLDEAAFLKATEGSALRRLSYWQWQRNLAVALGNGPATKTALAALETRRQTLQEQLDRFAPDRSEAERNQYFEAYRLLLEHVQWAIAELEDRQRWRKKCSR